jgi:hypothetical protein
MERRAATKVFIIIVGCYDRSFETNKLMVIGAIVRAFVTLETIGKC